MLSERQTYLRRVHHRREAHQIIWKSGRASSLVQQNFRGPLNAAEYSGGMCSWRGRTQVIKIGCANQGNWSCSRHLVQSNWGNAGDWFIYQKLTSHQLNIKRGMLHWSTCNAKQQCRFATHVFCTNLQTCYTLESLPKTSNALQHCKYRKKSFATGRYTRMIFCATSDHCNLALQVDQCNITFRFGGVVRMFYIWHCLFFSGRNRCHVLLRLG